MAIETKFNMPVASSDIAGYLSLSKNKIYKLLPLREEGLDWEKFLDSILIELSGFNDLFENKINLIVVLSKLEGLRKQEDFMTYRKVIFECLNSIDDLR